jgi:hypothetical protein
MCISYYVAHADIERPANATKAVCGPDMCWCVRIVAYWLQAATDLGSAYGDISYAHDISLGQLGRVWVPLVGLGPGDCSCCSPRHHDLGKPRRSA